MTRSARTGCYRWFFAGNLLMMLVVFAEPTASRLTDGLWKRGSFVFENTLSLDAHAAFGYLFVLAFITQASTGFAHRGGRIRALHATQGRGLLWVGAPLFVGVGLWMIFDRGLGLPPERTIVFRKHAHVLIAELVQVMTLVGVFLWQGWVAIRRRDVTAHVDAMLAAFLVAAMIAGIRLIYAVIWMFGRSPLSVSGTYLITVAVTAVELSIAYSLAGRLRRNAWVVALLLGSTAALAVLAWPWHSVWDVP